MYKASCVALPRAATLRL